MTATRIEWATDVWNPTTGCTRVSPGCEHCYIERTPPFRMQGRRFDGPQIGASTEVMLHPDRLEQPLQWRKPRRVFVNSLSDLFHADVPDEFIARVFAVMAIASQHTFLVLTKRPARMRSLLTSGRMLSEVAVRWRQHEPTYMDREVPWPPPNVVLVVSAEDQKRADERIPLLLDTPAAVRGVSCEPLLGPVDLHDYLWTDGYFQPDAPGTGRQHWIKEPGRHIDWVICGGESGPGARPMRLEWARSLVERCRDAGTACFVKQLGSRPVEEVEGEGGRLLTPVDLRDRKGGDPDEWPEDLRVREFPGVARG